MGTATLENSLTPSCKIEQFKYPLPQQFHSQVYMLRNPCTCAQGDTYTAAHSSSIHKSKHKRHRGLETAQMSNAGRMAK